MRTTSAFDLAFRQADAPTFEGEGVNVPLACAARHPLIVGESAVAVVEFVSALRREERLRTRRA
jgi:hypothetical protein